jgi:hypothetical protein
MLRTRHEWISKLAAGSGVIAGLRLENDIENADLDTNAFNLANCDAHCRLITRAIDELVTHNFSSSKSARDLLINLIRRNTYGAFAEVAAYDWLTRCYVRIATQVEMTPSDVLPSWLYLNPRATHRLTRGNLNPFRADNPHGTYIDDFADDDY